MCTKICGICKKDLPETEEFFATRERKGKITFQWQCRECQKDYRKQHYEKNKQKYINKAKINRQKTIDEFKAFKQTLKCNRCPENRWWVLDFHHIDPLEKDNQVSVLVRKVSKERLMKEIKKCEVLCSNCHRDLHYQQKADNA